MPKDFATTIALSTSQCSTGYPPWAWLAFDPLDNSFWVASPSSCVAVISSVGGYSGNVTAAYPVGKDPFGVAVDTTTGNVYVTNTGSNNVTVIDGATGVTVANITVGSSPYGVAYDPLTGNVYVANGGSDNLSVISDSTEKVIASVGVGTTPIGVTVDPSTGQVFVANNGSGNVSILATSNNTVVANLDVGQNPYGIALDNVSDQVYVTNRGSDTVSVIDAWNDSVSVTIGTGLGVNPEGVAYNPVNGLIWVGAVFYTVLINTTTQSVLGYLATDPSGVAVDSTSGVVCVTNTANATLRCITYPDPIFPGLQLGFVESGLPATTGWSVTLDWPGYYRSTQQNTTGYYNSPIWFYVFAGSTSNYTYVIPPTGGYYPSKPTDTISISSGLTINVTFLPLTETYPVNFSEAGLPAGTPWNATLGGVANRSSTDQITFREPNGTYRFSILAPPGFAAHPAEGSVTVNGSTISRTITFGPAPLFTFTVLFNESGLPLGRAWYVDLNGVWGTNTTPSIEFAIVNGSYHFKIGPIVGLSTSPATGVVDVNGSAVTVRITFAVPMTYAVTFDETGLRSGTLWAVNFNGSIGAATIPQIRFNASNGTYSFAIPLPAGYSASAANGSLSVRGSELHSSIRFSATSIPLSANFSYQIEYVNCLSNGGVTNYVLLIAEAAGGTAPYDYSWILPTGTSSGMQVDTSTTYGQNNTVTLTVSDSAGHSATRSDSLGMQLPPCPPPWRNGSQSTSAVSLSLDQWAIIGLTAALVAVTFSAAWLRFRGRGGSSVAP